MKNVHHHSSYSIHQILTAPTGQVILLSSLLIFVFWKDINDFPRVPKILKVLLVSERISQAATFMDLPRENLIR